MQFWINNNSPKAVCQRKAGFCKQKYKLLQRDSFERKELVYGLMQFIDVNVLFMPFVID